MRPFVCWLGHHWQFSHCIVSGHSEFRYYKCRRCGKMEVDRWRDGDV